MKLEETVIIVANQGEIKVYKIKKYEKTLKGELKTYYSLDMLNAYDYIDAHKKLHETVTDEAGRFGHNIGEEHEVQNERKKRLLKDIAKDIDTIVSKLKPEQVFLSFPKEHHPKLMDQLSEETKKVIAKNIPLDLVKIPQDKVLNHFLD